MPPQFVFQTQNLAKNYAEKTIFEGMSLSFLYGAKIGIVGENGTGKTSLLRIMAGMDQDYMGTAQLAKGMRVGYVPQEPKLNPGKTVRGNLEEALEPVHALIRRYDEVADAMGEKRPKDQMDKLMDEMSRLQEQIDAMDAWEVDRLLDVASDALVLVRNITFYCIFIDYRMPDMNGDDVCRLLRPQNPVALIVGLSVENKHSAFLDAGADAFILKDDFFRDLDTVLI